MLYDCNFYQICDNSSLNELSDHERKLFDHQNCLMLSQRLDQKNHLQNKLKIHDSNLSSTMYAAHHDNNIIKENHLKLTSTVESLRIQNKRLKQELMKYWQIDNEAFRLRNHVKHLTAPTQTQNLTRKVRMLKKTIAKLKKLNDTIKHVYEKKLQHIIKVRYMKHHSFSLSSFFPLSLSLFLIHSHTNKLSILIIP